MTGRRQATARGVLALASLGHFVSMTRARSTPNPARSLRTVSAVVAGLAVWGAASAAAGAVVPGLFAVVVLGPVALLYWRLAEVTGPPTRVEAGQFERVTGMVRSLCERAGCPPPVVQVRGRTLIAGVKAGRRGAVLFVGAGVLDALDDRELRALLAHEVAHLRRRDHLVHRRRALGLLLASMVVVVVLLAVLGLDPVRGYPFAFAAMLVSYLLLNRATASGIRAREIAADNDGARLTGDPVALASALEKGEAMNGRLRARVRGAAPISWLLAPLLARPRTHPATSARVAALRSMTVVSAPGASLSAGPPPPPPPPPPAPASLEGRALV